MDEIYGFVVEELEDWINKNIDTDYSTREKLFKLLIPNEVIAANYVSDLDNYEIDGKLYFFVPEDIADEPYSEAKR